MHKQNEEFYCINCGKQVENLYKRYSPTVLKLTECQFCQNIADKYIEYDPVIVIIDLILLRISAFRHILLNFEFKNFWKLFILILLLESYTEWSSHLNNVKPMIKNNKTEPYLVEDNLNVEDWKFYNNSLVHASGSLAVVFIIFLLTKVYEFTHKSSKIVSLVLVFKMVTLSNCSLFLLLPSLIWDMSILEYHQHFLNIYSTLTQLLAYKAIRNCSNFWTLIVIFTAVFNKHFLILALDSFRDYPLNHIVVK